MGVHVVHKSERKSLSERSRLRSFARIYVNLNAKLPNRVRFCVNIWESAIFSTVFHEFPYSGVQCVKVNLLKSIWVLIYAEGRLRNGQRFSKIQSIITTWRKKPMSRSYTPEFKKDALRYVKEHKGSSDLHTIADNLGVPYHTLYGWIKDERRIQRLSSAEKVEAEPRTAEELERENARLRRELRDKEDALEILKKAIGILND